MSDINNRRSFLKNILATSVAMGTTACSSETTFTKPHPPVVTPVEGNTKNVLFIAVDDLNDWVHCFTPHIAPGVSPYTPNFDAFATKGMLFENAHTPIALCNPARSAVFYGAQPHLSGIMNNFIKDTSDFNSSKNCFFKNRQSLNGYFMDKGYQTYGVGKLYHNFTSKNTDGKWTLYRDALKGDGKAKCVVTMTASHPGFDPKFPGRPAAARVNSGDPKTGCPNGVEHFDVYVANFAVEQIRAFHSQPIDAKPFFLGAGFVRPHAPHYAPTWAWDMYSKPAIKAYLDSLMQTQEGAIHPELAKFFKVRVEKLKVLYKTGALYDYMHGYLASITFIDHLFGQIVDALKVSRFWDNTAVVLWSDHGYHFGEKMLMAKQTLWERATRFPMIVRVPGMNEGTRSNSIVSSLGLYNTLAELCFGEKPPGIDGKSFAAVLADPKAEVQSEAVTALALDGDNEHVSAIKSIGYSVRQKEYRYTIYRLYNPNGVDLVIEELYHLPNDPLEMNNLVANGLGSYKDLCESMRRLIPTLGGITPQLPALNCR